MLKIIPPKEHYTTFLINKLLYAYFTNTPSVSTIRIAKMNKVLYQLGRIFPEVQKTDEWLEVSRRRVAQMGELIRFNKVANEVGLRYVVVKTFRFPGYVPDDIDVLIHPLSQHLIWRLASTLISKHGYFLRSKGTTEMTLRKVIDGTYVDFDVHSVLGAGYYIYLDAKHVFENSHNISLEDESIPVVNKEFELIICAAHATMKEFELTLADLLTFLYLYSSMGMMEVLRVAERVGLKSAVYTFCRLSQFLVENILKGKDLALPYRIPVHSTVLSYAENIRYRMNFSGIKPVKDLLAFPSAKGVKRLIGLR